MRRFTSRRALLTILALAAPLVLSSSMSAGSDPAVASGAEGAVCSALRSGPSLQEGLDRVRASAALSAGRTGVVTLNGGGYNYGALPGQEMDRIQLELDRARAARQR